MAAAYGAGIVIIAGIVAVAAYALHRAHLLQEQRDIVLAAQLHPPAAAPAPAAPAAVVLELEEIADKLAAGVLDASVLWAAHPASRTCRSSGRRCGPSPRPSG